MLSSAPIQDPSDPVLKGASDAGIPLLPSVPAKARGRVGKVEGVTKAAGTVEALHDVSLAAPGLVLTPITILPRGGDRADAPRPNQAQDVTGLAGA